VRGEWRAPGDSTRSSLLYSSLTAPASHSLSLPTHPALPHSYPGPPRSLHLTFSTLPLHPLAPSTLAFLSPTPLTPTLLYALLYARQRAQVRLSLASALLPTLHRPRQTPPRILTSLTLTRLLIRPSHRFLSLYSAHTHFPHFPPTRAQLAHFAHTHLTHTSLPHLTALFVSLFELHSTPSNFALLLPLTHQPPNPLYTLLLHYSLFPSLASTLGRHSTLLYASRLTALTLILSRTLHSHSHLTHNSRSSSPSLHRSTSPCSPPQLRNSPSPHSTAPAHAPLSRPLYSIATPPMLPRPLLLFSASFSPHSRTSRPYSTGSLSRARPPLDSLHLPHSSTSTSSPLSSAAFSRAQLAPPTLPPRRFLATSPHKRSSHSLSTHLRTCSNSSHTPSQSTVTPSSHSPCRPLTQLRIHIFATLHSLAL